MKNNEILYEKEYFQNQKIILNHPLLAGNRPILFSILLWKLRKVNAKGKFLELGCGEGFFLKYASYFYQCIGTDISQYAVTKAKENAPLSKTFRLDLTNIPTIMLKPTYDIIVILDTLEHLENPAKVLVNINKMLKNNGILLLSVPNTFSLGKRVKKDSWVGYRDKTHVSLFSPVKWEDLLISSNFVIISKFTDHLWDTPYIKLVPRILQTFIFKIIFQVLSLPSLWFPIYFGETLFLIAKKA